MKEKVFLIAEKDESALGLARCIDSLMISKNKNGIWIKCNNKEDYDNLLIKQLPIQKTYAIDEHMHLFFPEASTPVEVLQIDKWIPIKEFIPVELPVAALPAKCNTTINIQIIPSEVERKGDALLTSLEVWKTYAEQASGIRLRQLRFAVSEKKEVFIIGNPLPSIPGTAYWVNKRIALPCGYELEWDFLADGIIQKLSRKNELILFNDRGEYEILPLTFFVQANRSAVRLTLMD